MTAPELDFSVLFNIVPDAPEAATTSFNIVNAKDRPLPSNTIQKRIEANKQALEEAQRVCKERAEQVRQSEALRSEIMRGLNEGMSTAEALLKAAEVIRLITGDTVFYNHIANAIISR